MAKQPNKPEEVVAKPRQVQPRQVEGLAGHGRAVAEGARAIAG